MLRVSDYRRFAQRSPTSDPRIGPQRRPAAIRAIDACCLTVSGMSPESPIFVECENGVVRVYGETAVAEVNGALHVWRGPFSFEPGSVFVVPGPRGPEPLADLGAVISWVDVKGK